MFAQVSKVVYTNVVRVQRPQPSVLNKYLHLYPGCRTERNYEITLQQTWIIPKAMCFHCFSVSWQQLMHKAISTRRHGGK